MDDYNVKLHREGRIWTIIALVIMALVPILACIIMETGPDWKALAIAFAILTAMNLPVALGEVTMYSYMLGTSGSYLAFVTGNLSNLKIPCVINAANIAGTSVGTEENEIASTISIAVSALTTTVIIGLGVFLVAITNLDSVFKSPYLQPAFNSVVYALFGALGGQYLVKYPKIAILPFIGMTALCIIFVVSGLGGTLVKASYMVFVGVIACFFNAKRLYYKKCQEKDAAEAAAALGADGALLDEVIDEVAEAGEVEDVKAVEEIEEPAEIEKTVEAESTVDAEVENANTTAEVDSDESEAEESDASDTESDDADDQ